MTARAALACGVETGLSCRTEPSRGLSRYLQETVSRRPESQDSRLVSELGGKTHSVELGAESLP